ncbi:NADPH-dependent diflavin oxidoreductase 1 like protein [Verticillium longisporum]|nr:NADPH-dependent diflavin oxidoreductase 1 like protein [Verticillium longisporum]
MAVMERDQPVELADLPGRHALVLYGSETGNSQDIAEELGKMTQRLHFKTKVDELNVVQLNELLRYTLVIIVISTTGQGDMPQNSLAFWKSLLRRKLPPGCLKSTRFTTFGLGDSSYPKFNWAARKLHKRLEQLGATEFYPRGEGNEQDDDGIDQTYLPWSIDLRTKILEYHPLPSGLSPIPDTALLPPKYMIKISPVDTPRHSQDTAAEGIPNLQSLDFVRGSSAAATSLEAGAEQLNQQALQHLISAVPGGLVVEVNSNTRVTPTEHWQDVRRLSFEIRHLQRPSLQFNPGDCLRLYPRNLSQDVDKLLDVMQWGAIADDIVDLGTLSERPTGLYTANITTLRRLLTENLDITAIPRRSFLEAISHHCTDSDHKERLLEFTKSEYIDEYYDYATRPRRTIIEVLEEFHSVQFPPEYVLDVFPMIRGRDFSIASIEPPEPGSDSIYKLELLVALVKYQTVLRKIRTGLCSRYINLLAAGNAVLASHKPSLTSLHGKLHARRPLCAFATGTGIAPIHALIQERLRYDDTDSATGRTLLFFGNRSRNKDFFFADEWAAMPSSKLEVHTAFSRDQKEKIYIQDIIRQQAQVVADMARENVIFIVCGGSSKMATACRAAVVECLRVGGLCETETEAEEMLGRLTWWQEIW